MLSPRTRTRTTKRAFLILTGLAFCILMGYSGAQADTSLSYCCMLCGCGPGPEPPTAWGAWSSTYCIDNPPQATSSEDDNKLCQSKFGPNCAAFGLSPRHCDTVSEQGWNCEGTVNGNAPVFEPRRIFSASIEFGDTLDWTDAEGDSCNPLPCSPTALSATDIADSFTVLPTRTYEVTGSSCAEVANNLFDLENGVGFLVDGERFAGITRLMSNLRESSIRTSLRNCANGKAVCAAAPLLLALDWRVEITIPHWDPPAGTLQADIDAWNTAMAALLVHEQGHVDIYEEEFPFYKQTLQEVSIQQACGAPSTFPCELAATRKSDRLLSVESHELHEIDQIQQNYDAETNHGATQGAVLNCPGGQQVEGVSPQLGAW